MTKGFIDRPGEDTSHVYLERIDGIRGVAILLVFLYHTQFAIFGKFELHEFSKNGVLITKNLKSIVLNFNPFGQGWIGVNLFLVISGFLIHYIQLTSSREFNFRFFISKRFWRIYPPYIIVLLFLFISSIDLTWEGLKDISFHVLMIHNLDADTFLSINPSFWSIALEWQLYLIYPLYLYLLKNLGSDRSFGLVILIHLILSLIGAFFQFKSNPYIHFILTSWFVWCAGAWLADKYLRGKRIFNQPFQWFLILFLLFFAFKLYYITAFFNYILATFICIAFVEWILYSNGLNNSMVRWVGQFLTFIGLCSYSLYLIHQPYLSDLINFYNPNTGITLFDLFIRISFSFLTLVLLSYALYKLVEVRSIDFGKKLRGQPLLSTGMHKLK